MEEGGDAQDCPYGAAIEGTTNTMTGYELEGTGRAGGEMREVGEGGMESLATPVISEKTIATPGDGWRPHDETGTGQDT